MPPAFSLRPLPLLPLVALTLLPACTVGPDYAGPASAGAVSAPSGFARANAAATADAPALGAWWTALGDPLLDALESRALAANPNVQIAQARLRQARASLRTQRANQLPAANAQATYVHAELPGIDLGSGSSGGDTTALNFYNLGFDASWEIDLFGGGRRQVEGARATAQAAEANVADAQVSLSADVAQAYVLLRDAQARLALTDDSIARQQQMLDLTRQRRDRGTASDLDVERMRGALEQSVSQRAAIDADRAAFLNALAVLTGAAPGSLDGQLAAEARLMCAKRDL